MTTTKPILARRACLLLAPVAYQVKSENGEPIAAVIPTGHAHGDAIRALIEEYHRLYQAERRRQSAPDALLGGTAAAELAGVSRPAIDAARRSNELPAQQTQAGYRYLVRDLKEWAKTHGARITRKQGNARGKGRETPTGLAGASED